MSGVQGPLETRAKTTVETAAALAGLDATPWDSGELAYVRSTGATYELVREDLTVGPSTFDSIAVSPPGSVGRWQRVCFTCSGGTAGGGITGPTGPAGVGIPFVAYAIAVRTPMNTNPSTSSAVFVDLISTSIITSGGSLLMRATVEGDLDTNGQAIFIFAVDGVNLNGVGQPISSIQTANPAGDVGLSTSMEFKFAVAPGLHTVSLRWETNGPTATINVISGTDHATLAVQEVL